MPGIENPSYYISDSEQPSTSHGIYNMFQPNVSSHLGCFLVLCVR